MTVDTSKTRKKYVHLEMIFSKDKRDDVVSGLFKGILESNGDIFILLHGAKDSTKALNTKFYDFMGIEELEEEYKNLWFFKSLKSDQEEALKIVRSLYKVLLDNGFSLATDPVLVDIEKYSELPEAYKEGKSSVASKGTGGSVYRAPANTYSHAGGYHNRTTTYTPPAAVEPEAKFFQRTDSKKPSKSDLDTMFAKMDLIKKNEYKPVLVDTPEDSPTDEPIREVKNTYAEYGYMNGIYE